MLIVMLAKPLTQVLATTARAPVHECDDNYHHDRDRGKAVEPSNPAEVLFARRTGCARVSDDPVDHLFDHERILPRS